MGKFWIGYRRYTVKENVIYVRSFKKMRRIGYKKAAAILILVGLAMIAYGLLGKAMRPNSYYSSFTPPATLSFMDKSRMAVLRFDTEVGRGSATHVKNGVALTAAHVCHMLDNIPEHTGTLLDYEGNNLPILEYQVYPDNNVDLCIIKFVPISYIPETPLAPLEETVLQTKVFIPSFAGGVNYSIRSGVVLTQELVQMGFEQILDVNITDAIAEPGASGSGAVNSKGEMIGITILKVGNNHSGLTPLKYLHEIINNSKLGHETR